MTTQILQATPDRIPVLVDVLAKAFATDPLLVWPMTPGSGHEEVSRFFAFYDWEVVNDGWLWQAGEASGVALWVPPDGGDRYGEVDERIIRVALRHELSDDAGARYESMWELDFGAHA